MWHFDKLSGRGDLIIWGYGDVEMWEFENVKIWHFDRLSDRKGVMLKCDNVVMR